MDRSLDITTDGGPFRELWIDYRGLVEPIASGPLGQTTHRRGPRRPVAQSPDLYAALAGSPFVSLYSTASAGEDFAELTAWHEWSRRSDISLLIEVRDGAGRAVATVRPLLSPAVQARFRRLDAVLAAADAASAPQ